jgi:hypothetical protein
VLASNRPAALMTGLELGHICRHGLKPVSCRVHWLKPLLEWAQALAYVVVCRS